LLRAYRLGHARFSHWLLTELAECTGDAEIITATALSLSRIVAGYIDQTSEEIVAAYSQERGALAAERERRAGDPDPGPSVR
jgi:hypothetical protein